MGRINKMLILNRFRARARARNRNRQPIGNSITSTITSTSTTQRRTFSRNYLILKMPIFPTLCTHGVKCVTRSAYKGEGDFNTSMGKLFIPVDFSINEQYRPQVMEILRNFQGILSIEVFSYLYLLPSLQTLEDWWDTPDKFST